MDALVRQAPPEAEQQLTKEQLIHGKILDLGRRYIELLALVQNSNLVRHAERELRMAGAFDKDGDYGGMLGDSVLELVRVFALQGHSGFSAKVAIMLFARVASYDILTPLGNPTETGEYLEVAEGVWQSTRKGEIFSEDGGQTWYDIDGTPKNHPNGKGQQVWPEIKP